MRFLKHLSCHPQKKFQRKSFQIIKHVPCKYLEDAAAKNSQNSDGQDMFLAKYPLELLC